MKVVLSKLKGKYEHAVADCNVLPHPHNGLGNILMQNTQVYFE